MDTISNNISQSRNPLMEKELGRPLRSADVARYLGLDVKTVRAYYESLGGVRLGRKILFFERRLIDAIQKRSKMGSPSETQWEEERKDIFKQEGCIRLGERNAAQSRADMASEDKHGVIV